MNEYEIMLLLDPELAEERGNEIIQRIRDSVEGAGGTWDGHEPWGRRRLAYEIQHKSEAVYHLLLFTSPARDARRDHARPEDHRRGDPPRRLPARQGRPYQAAVADPGAPPVAAPSDDDGDRIATAVAADDSAEATSSLGRPVGEERKQWPTSTASFSSAT